MITNLVLNSIKLKDDDCFINKAQFDTGFADRLMLKDGAVATIKVHSRSCVGTAGGE